MKKNTDTCSQNLPLSALGYDVDSAAQRQPAEELLRLNERRLTDIVEFLPDALLAIDKDKRIIIWNKAIEKMTGIPAADMMGKGDYAYTIPFYGVARSQLMDLVFMDDREVAEKYQNLEREGDTIMAEVFCPAMYDNKGAWIFVKVSPLHDQEGNVIGAIEIIRDITQRKQAEEALSESEARFRRISNITSDVTYSCRSDAEGCFSIDWMSGAAEGITGYTAEEIKREGCWRFLVLEEDKEIFDKNVIGLAPGTHSSCEFRLVHKNGHIVWVSSFAECAPANHSTSCLLIYGGLVDITLRKKTQDVLKQSEEKYRLIFENTPLGVLHFNSEGVISDCNETFVGIIGSSKKALVGLKLLDLPDERITNALKEALQGRRITYEGVYKSFTADKETAVRVMFAPILSADNKVNAGVGIIEDITRRKKREEEIEYLSYHDQLTGLYNRRFYEEELIRLDTARNLPISIAMGDVNGLKLINDSFGHTAGDEYLRMVAEVIKKGCRVDDIVARLGGDEFVIILPKTSALEAEKVIMRIKELAAKEKSGTINVSISFGFETKIDPEESIQEIFKKTEDHMYRHKLYESSSMRSKTIDLIMNTLYEKNNREMLHSKRVAEICQDIASRMHIDKDEINQIRIAGLMHDIGKIGIEEKILNKAQKLNDEEWIEMKRHPEIGYRILSSVNEFSEIAGYVLEHQERWDGSGYPRALKGEEISLPARIIAIADAFDAMTTHRTYGKILDEEEAVNEIKRYSGMQFDPEIAAIFAEMIRKKVW